MSGAANIAGRMERLPLSRFHYMAFLVIGVAMLFDGYDLTIAGFVLPPLKQVGWMEGSNREWFISLPLLAAAAGSVAAGAIGDRVGRRRLFFVNVAIYSAGSLLCGLATSYPMLLGARTVVLFGLGMQIVTGYSYMNELTPAQWRGGFVSAVALAVNGGLPIGAILAALLVPNMAIDHGWRVIFLVSVLPALLLLTGRKALPESPRWLASRGRTAEADRIVTEIERGIGRVLPPPLVLPPPAQNLGWACLMQGGVRRRFLLAVVFQICHLCSIFVLVSWLPSIMLARGMSMGSTFTFTAVSFAGGALGPLIAVVHLRPAGAALDRGRGGAGRCDERARSTHCRAMPFGLMIDRADPDVTAIYYISAVGFATYVPELLPTGVRLRGLGTSALIGRLASAGTPFVVAAVLAGTSNPLIVVTGVGCLYVILAVSIALFGPNTAGRSLEALERSSLEGGEADGARRGAFP